MSARPTPRLRAMWLAIYAVLCGISFVVEAMKEYAGERIKGKLPEEPKR